MFENLAFRFKASLGLLEYLGNPDISPCTIIRRPLAGIEDLLPAQQRTRLLTSLAVIKTFHKAGYLTADGLLRGCERVVKAAPEKERRELVNIALPLGLQAYKNPKAPYKPPGMLIGMITGELSKWVHKENYQYPMMSTENFAKQLLTWQEGLIRLLPESERLVPVNTALDFAKKVRKDGNIDNWGLRIHLSYLTSLVPDYQRRELVDFGFQLDKTLEQEQQSTAEGVLRNRVSCIGSLPADQRGEAAQRYGLWESTTAVWTKFATEGDSYALPTLRDAFALCGAPPAETGITGVTVSSGRLGGRHMVGAIFERTSGRPVAVIGDHVLNDKLMKSLAGNGPPPTWMGRVDPAEREFIRQNLLRLSAPATA